MHGHGSASRFPSGENAFSSILQISTLRPYRPFSDGRNVYVDTIHGAAVLLVDVAGIYGLYFGLPLCGQ